MSTSKEVQKQLDSVLRIPSNNKCADCKRKNNPRWASYSLGLVICIQCAGVHRSLGTHITKVKSIDLDYWQAEDAQKLVEMQGNDRANIKYEGKLMDLSSTGAQKEYVPRLEELKSYIKTKYDLKKWMLTDGEFNAYIAGKKVDLPAVASRGDPSVKSASSSAAALPELRVNGSKGNAHVTESSNQHVTDSGKEHVRKTGTGTKHSSPLDASLSTEKLSNLNLRAVSRSSTSASLHTPKTAAGNDRSELKKSILALYAKPKQARDSSSSMFNNANDSTVSLSSFGANNSTASLSSFGATSSAQSAETGSGSQLSLENDDLFKNVWS